MRGDCKFTCDAVIAPTVMQIDMQIPLRQPEELDNWREAPMSFWEKMEEKEADLDWIMIKCSLGSIERRVSSLAGKPRVVWLESQE